MRPVTCARPLPQPVFADRADVPVLVGHRGAGRGLVRLPVGQDVRENTLASFHAAAAAGATWIETDVARTADAQLVLTCDTVLPDGTPVAALPLSACVERGLTPATALADLPHLGVVLDVKTVLIDAHLPGVAPGPTTAELAVNLAATLRAQTPGRPLIAYGFDPLLPVTLQRLAAARGLDLPVGVICAGTTSLSVMTAAAITYGLQLVAGHVTSFVGDQADGQLAPHTLPEVVAYGHAASVEFLCWCPTDDEAAKVADAGVDAVCIDGLPARTRALI